MNLKMISAGFAVQLKHNYLPEKSSALYKSNFKYAQKFQADGLISERMAANGLALHAFATHLYQEGGAPSGWGEWQLGRNRNQLMAFKYTNTPSEKMLLNMQTDLIHQLVSLQDFEHAETKTDAEFLFQSEKHFLTMIYAGDNQAEILSPFTDSMIEMVHLAATQPLEKAKDRILDIHQATILKAARALS